MLRRKAINTILAMQRAQLIVTVESILNFTAHLTTLLHHSFTLTHIHMRATLHLIICPPLRVEILLVCLILDPIVLNHHTALLLRYVLCTIFADFYFLYCIIITTWLLNLPNFVLPKLQYCSLRCVIVY